MSHENDDNGLRPCAWLFGELNLLVGGPPDAADEPNEQDVIRARQNAAKVIEAGETRLRELRAQKAN